MSVYFYPYKSLRDEHGNWEPISQGKWKVMKPKRINRTSTRRAQQIKEYAKVRPKFLIDHVYCVKCNNFIEPRFRTVHHFFGRTQELIYWVPGFRMACMPCHNWIETHRNDAVRLNLRAPNNLFGRPSKVIPR